MIVTLTANPSADRAVVLSDALAPGEVQRALSSREDAGGKGVNVARVVAAAGAPARAVVPVGAHDPYRVLLEDTGIALDLVDVAGRARANLTITDPAGETTKLNLPGAELSSAEAQAVTDGVVAAAEGATWLVLAGSLPPGVPASFYADLVAAVRERWAADAPRIAVDASGAALAEVVATARPDLIKPNHEELAELVGEDAAGDLDVITEATRRAHQLVPEHVASALVTLGADGALLFTAEGAWRGYAPKVQVASTVGAGDSSLAGYLLADLEGASAPDRLARSIAYGAAAATLPGTQPPTPADLPAGPIAVSVFSTPTATS
ncbi:1-phosphofructokinase family hexose kinase [Microbacterium sp. KSW2-21]|uniref:1-phosphofructokinase family hexose kinase n=1 Tax=Microbacterium algihabitans TaxID=3075992 RepID=A0ABU3RV67_9MICO|nr:MULTISPECIES: 1-phosphofructokinase family hexose kinase [unclassified Microbacterium]MDU0326771.1 1-phosphofructokinase family hexose kinase [Microbacterium sp. KSW2-21]